jgi:hypothetical protein
LTSDVRWDDVREWFDPEANGSLPDVCVRGTTIADWQGLIDLIRSQGWAVEYSEDGRILRLPDRAEDLLDRHDGAGVVLKVSPAPEVELIFFPYAAEQIDGDVDLRELQGQERLDILCGFLRDVGRALGKPVWMTPEAIPDRPLLEYRVEADQVVLLAAPLR